MEFSSQRGIAPEHAGGARYDDPVRGGASILRAVLSGLVVGAVSLGAPGAVRAEEPLPEVVVLEADPEWLDALRVALEPWGLLVRGTSGSVEEVLQGRRGGGGASTANTAAIVWIDRAGASPHLVVYLAEEGRRLERRLSALPPYDAPTAAAVALTVKTLLRQTRLAPGATPPRPRHRLRLGAGGALRAGALSPGGAEARLSGFGSIWPSWSGPPLGLGLRLVGGVPLPFEGPAGSGRWREVTILASVEVAARLLSWLDLGLALEGGLRMSRIRLRLEDGLRRGPERVAPSLRVLGSVGLWATPELRIALEAGIAAVLGPADYELDGARVAREESVGAVVGLTATAVLSP
jgi:hypothetical protein